MTLIDILLVVLILAAISLCVFLIVYLKKITDDIQALRKDIDMLIDKTIPAVDNLNETVDKARRIVSDIEDYWTEIDSSIKRFKEKVNSFKKGKILKEEEKAANFISNLRAVAKGLRAFWSTMARK
ncbi:DUF948 domain-containing protein [Melioribacter sp. Ez-97]|uniref:DUF948 domain-containing protein n=1 Tax=Melioribacter sp. Ez-97 TaxID=3423434 RepID=UPI003EDB3423